MSSTPDVHEIQHQDLLQQPRSYFENYPCMLGSDVVHLEQVLTNLTADPARRCNVLEWGLGGSTIYFTNFLAKLTTNWHWTVVEHDASWYKQIVPRLDAQHTSGILHQQTSVAARIPKHMQKYIMAPLSICPVSQFDLILVDGRCRRRCLLVAAEVLKPGGVCLLHDAQRVYYHKSFVKFGKQRFIPGTMWWEGTTRQ